ncbi:DUF1350 family protein [Candidatus Synechococcus calcipolaris G9]|uniref:DUF1350 family protein n=1 Tax=Candidatus Synechococcus calcipolaris G9 TaxID=1497997 RepID=A0ABT6F1T9_9SYNE|nr:DUF1350 family protein [Candidatus Synechococcus calcipolaris]MDG2991741.1 DUF1350 family protein [Candidatus Synechococcus calcipolaris G9]
MDWQEVRGNWLLIPPRSRGIIHFLGGAFLAAAPQVSYRRLLEFLAEHRYAIVATPFVNTFDHLAIARDVLTKFEYGLDWLEQRSRCRPGLPIYGLGHSMGCKLQLLIGSTYEVERAGNIFLAFNNYAANQSIPFMENVNVSGMEFIPSPRATERLIEQAYPIRRNLLIRFQNDDIDQTGRLSRILKERFDHMVTTLQLPGNHLTPLGQTLSWQPGAEFSPLDAVGQWLRQGLFPELTQLEQTLIKWLI